METIAARRRDNKNENIFIDDEGNEQVLEWPDPPKKKGSVSTLQRQGKWPNHSQKYKLIGDDHWLNQVRMAYTNRRPDLQNTGRLYRGSDTALKNLNSIDVDGQATSYIYIISKTIAGVLYFKIGIGGIGDGDSGSRLTDAQTYLIIGLGEEISFNVHYLIFYPKKPYKGYENMAHYVESLLHKELQFEFNYASITFPNRSEGKSEWYLVRDTDVPLFLGFTLDLLAFINASPAFMWKIEDGKDDEREIIHLPEDFMSRLKRSPRLIAEAERLRSLNVRTVIEYVPPPITESEEEVFKKELMEQTVTIRENGDVKEYSFKNLQRNEITLFIDDNANQSTRAKGSYVLVQLRVQRGINTRQSRLPQLLFQLEKEFFQRKNMNIFMTKRSDIENTENELQFYMELGDVLTFIEDSNHNEFPEIFKQRQSFLQAAKTAKVFVDTAPTTASFIAPSWYFDLDIQLEYVQKIIDKNSALHTHTDYDKMYRLRAPIQWVTNKYTANDSNVNKYSIHREPARDQQVSANVGPEYVSIVRVMNALRLNERPQKQEHVTVVKSMKLKKGAVSQDVEKGNVLQLKDSYFVQFDEQDNEIEVPPNDFKYFKVLRLYIKTFKSGIQRMYVDIVQLPKKSDQSEWVIDVTDFNANHGNKLMNIIRLNSAINKIVSDLQLEEDQEDLENERVYRANPKYHRGEVVRFKPSNLRKYGSQIGERTTPKDQYHYVTIQGTEKIAEIQVYYKIKYFEPYHLEKAWIRGQSTSVAPHFDKIRISLLDTYSELVVTREEREELRVYKARLLQQGEDIMEVLYHQPKGLVLPDVKRGSKFSHLNFSKYERKPMYRVKAHNGRQEIEISLPAKVVYENAPEVVTAYWEKLQHD